MFLKRTIDDILEHSEANTEIIAWLDWQWADPALDTNDRVNIIYYPESIWQRAMTNQCVRLAQWKYIMKVDAHCSFDQGFDRKMLEKFNESWDNVVMVPTMRNLWAFDWKCHDCWNKWYQWPTYTRSTVNWVEIKTPIKCSNCGWTNYKRKMMWIWKQRPQSNSYCFDSEPHFQYFNEYTKRPEYKDWDLVESMSIQGSCFMVSKDKYWELNLSDENFWSWWSQWIEVACKLWLSGWRVLINKTTWYAHLFRTQWNDFSFPYRQDQSKVNRAKKMAKDIFFNSKFEWQKLPLSWLVEKFWPVKGWKDEDLKTLKENEK
jgi:hypothetical protein